MISGKKSVGHPIDVASGEQFTAAHDLDITGVLPLRFRRYYSTSAIGHPGATLGVGWTHEYQMALVRDLDGYRYYGHDGDTVTFDDPGDVVNGGGRLLNAESSMELRREGDRYALYHWHDWQTPVKKFMFKAGTGFSMVLQSVELPSGHALVLGYDEKGRVSSVRQTVEKRRFTLDYDEKGWIRRLTLHHPSYPSRLIAEYGYDALGRLVGVRDAAVQITTYGYDDKHRLTLEKGRAGGAYRMAYDSKGRCIESTGDNGFKRTRLDFDEANLTTTVHDAVGNAVVYQKNKAGQILEEKRPDGGIIATAYDGIGRVVSRTDPGGGATAYAYDANGNLAKTEYPNGSKLEIEYDEFHQPIEIRQSGGPGFRFEYRDGLLMAVEGPNGREEYVYGQDRMLSEAKYPNGGVARFAHDADWTTETTTDDYGLVETVRYDIFLLAVESKKGVNGTHTAELDVLGHIIALGYPDGSKRRYQRNAEGWLTAYTDARGNTTRFEYTPYGVQTAVHGPLGTVVRAEHDAEGRVTAAVNEKGERAQILWDACHRIASIQAFDGRRDERAYDKGGRMTAYRRPDGTWLTYEYDAVGNLLKVGKGDEVLAAYAYDAEGRPVATETPDRKVEYKYDAIGRLLETAQDGEKTAYAYHPHGALASRHFQGGRIGPLAFSFDTRGRLERLAEGRREIGRYAYDASNQMVQREFPGGTERLSYDARGRIVSQRVLDRDFLELIKRDYAYDAENNLVSRLDSRRGGTEYAYDAGERLAGVRSGDGRAVQYRYDVCSNLLGREGEAAWEYGPGNRLLRQGNSRYEWDANGQIVSVESRGQITRYHWNDLGQLRGITFPDGKTARYGYDAAGRRAFKEAGGERTRYFWDGDDLLSERNGDAVLDYAMGSSTPDFLWDDKRLLVPVLTPPGLLTEILDEYGTLAWQGQFDEWGRPLDPQTLKGPSLRFPGQTFDEESGLHYNRHRYYDPWQGRYISADPLGLAAGMNEFAYCLNPVNWIDPLGLVCGKGTGQYSVYVLTAGKPKKIVYVGITMQDPAERMSQHRSDGKQFDNMVVVKSGLCYRGARDIEGSALHHIADNPGNFSNLSSGGILNAPRTNGYYHGYYDPPGGNRTLMSATDTQDALKLSGPGRKVLTP